MKIIIATKNKGKLAEFARILEPAGYQALSLTDIGFDRDIEETGATFQENAFIKARTISASAKEIVLADDSGLCVDYLHGAPGVYSARYAGQGATDEVNIAKLLGALSGVPEKDRTARFVCALAWVFPDGKTLSCEGTCEGLIGTEKRGDGGFGYDPVFMVNGISFAEMDKAQKDAVSHRGKAVEIMLELLENERRHPR